MSGFEQTGDPQPRRRELHVGFAGRAMAGTGAAIRRTVS